MNKNPEPVEQERMYCGLHEVPEPVLPAGMDRARHESLVVLANKWANGTNLKYYFFDRDTDGANVRFTDGSVQFMPWTTHDAEKDLVRAAFAEWKNLGIGLTFEEADDRNEAEVRIGFQRFDGYWSNLGKDVLRKGPAERTMNFGRDLTTVQDGMDTALHEIGHTLGLPHEHQSPKAGIVWDEEAVYAALKKPPNGWDRGKTFHNIIRKLAIDDVQGSSWDQDSIMHYPFEANLIKEPVELQGGLDPAPGLSDRDKVWIQKYYPPIEPSDMKPLEVFKPVSTSIPAGEQLNFLIQPTASRKYTIRTFGDTDTVLVLFEDINRTPTYMTADDDGGHDRNANLNVKLHAGRRYILRARLYYQGATGDTAIMMW